MKKTRCKMTKCGKPLGPIHGRGLCNRCYQQARLLVERKETTWEELESLGLCLPVNHKPRPEVKEYDRGLVRRALYRARRKITDQTGNDH